MNIKLSALRLQILDHRAQMLVEDRYEFVDDVVVERRIQQFPMHFPVFASHRYQTHADERLNESVRSALVDAQRRVEDRLDIRWIVDVDEQFVAHPEFGNVAVLVAMYLEVFDNLCRDEKENVIRID